MRAHFAVVLALVAATSVAFAQGVRRPVSLVVIGGNGVEKIIEVALTADEKVMLKKSADSVQGIVDVVRAAT